MSGNQGHCWIGTSGYHYAHWRGVFYPEELSTSDWLDHYAEHFDTLEINNTFYKLPEASTVESWKRIAGDRLCFALKFSRYGSHLKKLKDAADTIDAFLDRARLLDDALGPILVQLPPNWGPDVDRLAAFLDQAPRAYRWAVELRDDSWLCEGVYEVLRAHDAALCIHDMIDDHPEELTADWVYLRFHGDRHAGSYSHQFLTALARRIEGYRENNRDVYVYFNNDQDGHAVHNALELKRYVSRAAK